MSRTIEQLTHAELNQALTEARLRLEMSGGRIPCTNPRCRRTAPAEKYEPDASVVCRKCWRTIPKRITDTYRRLDQRRRQMERLARAARLDAVGDPPAAPWLAVRLGDLTGDPAAAAWLADYERCVAWT